MKIFAGGIATETNTFCPIFTDLEDFAVQRGKEEADGQASPVSFDIQEIWGKLAKARGDIFIFSIMAWAQPSGPTTRSTYEVLRDELLADLRAAGPVDVVLLMLHGAMIAQGYDDCEEDIIRCVRAIVGSATVIGVELDLHCHLSRSKIAPADIVVTYKEYPHVDINDRAKEVFDLAIRAKLGKIRPTMALFDCRMIGLYPTSREPLRGFVDSMVDAERHEGVLSVSFGHGFQFADVPHAGAKILVVTDDDQVLAEQIATDFGWRVYELRREIGFDSLSLPMNEALSKAVASQGMPVVVADQADNIGGGAPGDATFALRWLLERRVKNVAMAIFYDPQAVAVAKKAGEGATLSVRLGGKVGPCSGDPVDLEATVISLRHDYVHSLPQQSGAPVHFRIGDVVALHCDGIDIIVSSERCQCLSPVIFSDLGVDPTRRQVLIVKSAQHFRAGFAPIARDTIYMAAPGAVAPDPRMISYRRLDTRRLYPWRDAPLPELIQSR